MKLATYRDGSRDGQLVVVSRDLALAHHAQGIAGRLQQVLDDWNFLSPQLEDLYATLNHGKARHAYPFDPARCMAPLPRAFQWLDGSAYPSHVQRLRAARGQPPIEDFAARPLMYQGAGDDFLGPCQDAPFASADWGIDFEAELAVVTGDVPAGAQPAQALDAVRLLMLANDWSLRELIPAELATGLGLVQGKPATAFAPVAVTPDELGEAWRGGRAHLAVSVTLNGQRFGRCDAGAAMQFHFGELLAHAARSRRLRAGSIVGGGTVSQDDTAPGFGCIAERRAVETLAGGTPVPYLRDGDRVAIDAPGPDGQSVFGAIDQTVRIAPAPAR